MREEKILNEYKRLASLNVIDVHGDSATIKTTIDPGLILLNHSTNKDLFDAMVELVEQLDNGNDLEDLSLEIEISGKAIFRDNKLIYFNTKDTQSFLLSGYSISEGRLAGKFIVGNSGSLKLV